MASTFGERDERVMPATYYHARRQREVGHQVFSGGARTTVVIVRVDILSKEYPPNVYGGAGVHVVELVKALRARGDIDAQVRAFGQVVAEAGTTGYPDLPQLAAANATMQTLGVDVAIAADCGGADLVHSHTWYANMAGHLASLLHGVPHVISAHSLEPLRPWKAEQLGGGYRVSSWVEKTAYEAAAAVIAVSHGMRADVLACYPDIDPAQVKVVHNGIDAQLWQPDHSGGARDVVTSFGIDPTCPQGDVTAWMEGDALYFAANTPKGEALLAQAAELLEACGDEAVRAQQERVSAILEKLPLAGFSTQSFGGQVLMQVFESEKWAGLSQSCLGCGTCTFVCPTCQCYDIRDYDSGNGVQHYRCWDSCTYNDFTLIAGGTPRPTQLQRYRQRFMHKLVYYPANNDGMYSCVGCGRCVKKCPMNLNIVKVIKALGEENK